VNHASVEVSLADALAAELPSADVAVANIARETIELLAPRLRSRLLVASGYLDTEPTGLAGFRFLRRRVADGWAADLYMREDEISARSRHSRV
jgi:hypothetical protein